MVKGKFVLLEELKKNNNQLILKNTNGFIIGRGYVLDLNDKDGFCLVRFSYYKKDDSRETQIECLELMLKYFFEKLNMSKINIIVDEEFSTDVFTMLGFSLEGFFFDSKVINNYYASELNFGMDYDAYKGSFVRKNPELNGERVKLKILTPKYADELLNYCVRNKAHLEAYEPIRDSAYFTIEHQRKLIIEDYRSYLNGKSVNFGIFKGDKLVGKIKISNIVLGIFRSGTIGYSIDKDEQGQGLMKEALRLIIEYAFSDLDMHRIEASALTDNVKSQRVLKACGFKELGINEKYLYINGEWRDHVTFYTVKN